MKRSPPRVESRAGGLASANVHIVVFKFLSGAVGWLDHKSTTTLYVPTHNRMYHDLDNVDPIMYRSTLYCMWCRICVVQIQLMK